MNVVFIIGNGFDLRLGLPTSYPEFLAYYKKQKPIEDGSNIQEYKDKFFARMEKGGEEWKDLEIALGKFY